MQAAESMRLARDLHSCAKPPRHVVLCGKHVHLSRSLSDQARVVAMRDAMVECCGLSGTLVGKRKIREPSVIRPVAPSAIDTYLDSAAVLQIENVFL